MELPDNRLVFDKPIPSLRENCAFRTALNLYINKLQNGELMRDRNRRASVDPSRSRNIENVNPSQRRRTVSSEPRRSTANDANTRREPRRGQVFSHPNVAWMTDAEIQEMTNGLNLPKTLSTEVNQFIGTVSKEIIDWLKNHDEWAIFSSNEFMNAEHLNLVVWRSDATIDYENTARHLVRNGRLGVYQRFNFTCQYFMEDEMRQARHLWFDMQDEDSDIFIGNRLLEHPTVVYWNSIISEDFPDYSTPSGVEYLANRARASNSRYFSSIKFALDKLNNDDRFLFGIRLLQNASPEVITFLLPRFTEEEQIQMFSSTTVAFDIIATFARSPKYAQLAIETWDYTKNFGQEEQYVAMMSKIGKLRCHPAEFGHVHRLLVDLWRATPESLKRHVYSLDQDAFVMPFCIFTNEGELLNEKRQRDDRILIEILQDANDEYRRKLWQKAWRSITNNSRPHNLKRIMNIMCFSTDEIEYWKREILLSDFVFVYFKNLIGTVNLHLLNNFVEFLIPNEPRQRSLFKRRLLEVVEDEDLFKYVRSCNLEKKFDIDTLCEFISEAFERDEEAEKEFRIRVISACFSLHRPCPGDWLKRIFEIAGLICEGELSNRVRERVRENLERFLQNSEDRYDLRNAEWRKLLKWCLRTNERRQFREWYENWITSNLS